MTQAEALSILKTGANVFLTGEPGSGKTHTVNQFVSWLRLHGIEPAITASTGIAATHVHGMTIHAWSGIGVAESLSESDVDAIASKEHVARRIGKTTTLIIDEVSMLSAGVLVMVDRVCREVKRNPRPFGGIQVVLVGDFFQLPPVGRRGAERPAFAFESSVWTELNPITCYLTEQHRQEDPRFLSVLASVRAADPDPTTVSSVLAREVDLEGFGEDVPRLFTHNVDVDRLNEERLQALPGAPKRFIMKGTGSPTMVESLKRGCLSPEVLVLKEGAVVMGTKNLPTLGIANGTLGTVIGFERGTDYPIVETHNGRTVTVAPAEWAVEEGGAVRARVAQVPLRLAWAITIHKSQGMSMDAAAIDLSKVFEYGQGYVALSRVRSLQGLYLLGWSENALIVHPQIASEDERFRDESEAARDAFAALEAAGERGVLERNFIQASGGSVEVVSGGHLQKLKKSTTYDETLKLLADGMSLAQAAKERGLTLGTICGHAEKLLQSGALTKAQVEEALPADVRKKFPQIIRAVRNAEPDGLTVAFEKLGKKYSFEYLRLARALDQT